jgi:phosphohistidine phosphatase
MRRLLLLRHAKAAQPSLGGRDYERALTGRGREDARRIGDLLAVRGLVPDLVIYSSAERTRETAEIVATNWPKRVKAVAERGLYEATRQSMLLRIRAAPDGAGVTLIVGHNPSIGELAVQLAGGGAREDRSRMADAFPTCGLAVLDFPTEHWANVAPHAARLVRFVTPADLELRGA